MFEFEGLLVLCFEKFNIAIMDKTGLLIINVNIRNWYKCNENYYIL